MANVMRTPTRTVSYLLSMQALRWPMGDRESCHSREKLQLQKLKGGQRTRTRVENSQSWIPTTKERSSICRIGKVELSK